MCMECKENGKSVDEKVELNNEKIRKMYYEGLPKWVDGLWEGKINWMKSIGHQVRFIYEEIEGEVTIIDYDKKYLYIKYLDKEPFKIKTNNFQHCMLGKLLSKITIEFKMEIGMHLKDYKRDITIIDREYKEDNRGRVHKYYKYKCNKCGWEGDDRSWITESNLFKGIGCSCCSGRTTVEHLNSIVAKEETHWMIKYFQGDYDEAKLYSKGSKQKICPICPDCGRVKDKEIQIINIYSNHSIGCSCSDGKSYNEKFMFNILEQLNIPFKTEFVPDWCMYEYKNKLCQGRYDFYFIKKDKKYIVETDGGWHKQDNNMSSKTARESKEIDVKKDDMAREHDIEPIRIDCYKSELEYIKNEIIQSKLNKLFDLSNIDWNKAEEFTLKNLVKLVCEIKRENPNMTTIEIGNMVKLERSTIINYLKKGSKIWDWINYDAKEEMRRNCIKNGIANGKPIEIFKDGISLGMFKSARELDRQSKSLFGVKLTYGNISSVCLNKRIHHQGFTFKYVENNSQESI